MMTTCICLDDLNCIVYSLISMAKKFAKLDYDIYDEGVDNEKKEVKVEEKIVKKEKVTKAAPTFVSTLIDVVDNAIDVSHLLQGTIIVFVINLLYVLIQQEGKGSETLVTIGCTFITCIIELIAVIRNRYLKGELVLPEWEYIYGIVFPLLIASLFAKDGGSAVSCMVVQIGYMNVFIRILVSYVVAIQFGVPLNIPVITAFSYEIVSYFLPYVKVSERNVLGMILTMMISEVGDSTEMIVLRGLVVSTIAAFIGAAIMHRIYVNIEDGSLRFVTLLALYGVFTITFLVTSDKLLYPIIEESPLVWVWGYVQRPVLKYWLLLAASVPIIFTILSRPEIHIAIRRKAWHIILFAALAKPLNEEPGLTAIALGVVIALLILVESIRYTKLPPFGDKLNKSLAVFADGKDSLGTMMSPAYLVLGVACPLWLNLSLGYQSRLSSYAGVLSVGLGDAAASVVGTLYGRQVLPGSRNGKTLEGTMAMAAALFLGTLYIEWVTGMREYVVSVSNTTVFAVVVALFEGLLEGNDNLWVPPLAYILLELLHRF